MVTLDHLCPRTIYAVNLPPVIDDDNISSAASKRPRLVASNSPSQQCSKDQSLALDIQEDLLGRKYIEVVCGGRTGKLVLDKFCKLEGKKGYGKCVEYSNKLVPPQEFEAIGGMNAMKCWKNL